MNAPGDTPKKSHYGNFDDAWGLVVRMLRSGEASALWALGLAAAGIAATPLDFLLRGRDDRAIAAAGEDTGPLVLIVGAPRSGTTLAYQILARHLEVSLFTNATALFPRAPLSGSALLGSRRRSANANFNSFYGNSAGLVAPNDGFTIWNRWLGEDRYSTPDSISDDRARDMRRFFAAWRERFSHPFLNKNNRNTDCVALLAKALPDAVFVEIYRDPVDVVGSLLKARETVQGDASKGWGLRSNDAAATAVDPVEAVARQVALVHDRLAQARDTIEPTRYLRVAYEDLCADPADFVESVVTSFTGIARHPDSSRSELSGFSVSRSNQLTDEDVARIRAITQ